MLWLNLRVDQILLFIVYMASGTSTDSKDTDVEEVDMDYD